MRLVAKHQDVGYQTPSQRPGCRNCAWSETYRPESGVVYLQPRLTCSKHGLEITSGGICNDHRGKAKAGESQLAFMRRQMDLLQAQSEDLQRTSPTWGAS